MKKYLMIVESPSKAKKIESYLGSEWQVVASVGHIQDISKNKDSYGGLGFDEQTLEIDYEPSEKGKEVINKLKANIKYNNFERILLATDPDREGEAIAQHLKDRLNLREGDYERCTFDAVDKQTLLKAIGSTRDIDRDLVHAQEARRMEDRWYGWRGTSATSDVFSEIYPMGRCQNPTTRIIVEREQAIKDFVPISHYEIKAECKNETPKSGFTAKLDLVESGILAKDQPYWLDKESAKITRESVRCLLVINSETKQRKVFAPMGFRTTTMQSEAVKKLGMNLDDVVKVAQKLYTNGLITYIRTDSTEISDDGFELLKSYCKEKNLPMLEKKRAGKKGAVAQEAHGCIRPTDFFFEGNGLSGNDLSLYELIRNRAIASQLNPALYNVTSTKMAEVDNKGENESELIFTTSSAEITDKGYLGYFKDENEESEKADAIPEKGVIYKPISVILEEKKTNPPSRFNESSLITEMEKRGIGRPSSTATIVKNIINHGYVKKTKKKGSKIPILTPEEKAFKMVKTTTKYLSVLNIDFTMQLENTLDSIANGDVDSKESVLAFFDQLRGEFEDMKKGEGVDIKKTCLNCGNQSLNRRMKKNKLGFYYYCTTEGCDSFFAEKDGNPVVQDAEFYNEDGSAKFPCSECGGAMLKRTSKAKGKKKHFDYWRCKNNEGKDKGTCDVFVYDKEGEPDWKGYERRKEQIKLKNAAFNEDGSAKFPCPKCGGAMIQKPENDKGVIWWSCENNIYKNEKKSTCDMFLGNACKDGENAPDIERYIKKIEMTTNEDGSAKFPCVDCGGKMEPFTSKNGNDLFRCLEKGCNCLAGVGDDGMPEAFKKKS